MRAAKKHNRGGYVRGCRCEVCEKANRDYQREYLRRRVAAGLVNGHGARKERA